eukprot:2845224-Prymnesium_polylepis.1
MSPCVARIRMAVRRTAIAGSKVIRIASNRGLGSLLELLCPRDSLMGPATGGRRGGLLGGALRRAARARLHARRARLARRGPAAALARAAAALNAPAGPARRRRRRNGAAEAMALRAGEMSLHQPSVCAALLRRQPDRGAAGGCRPCLRDASDGAAQRPRLGYARRRPLQRRALGAHPMAAGCARGRRGRPRCGEPRGARSRVDATPRGAAGPPLTHSQSLDPLKSFVFFPNALDEMPTLRCAHKARRSARRLAADTTVLAHLPSQPAVARWRS